MNRRRTVDPPAPLVLDLASLGVNTKGVARVLAELAPRMAALAPDRYIPVCSPAGVPILRDLGLADRAVVTRVVSNAVFEQVGLPRTCTRLGAGAVYSHRECGALWGPPQLLHVTEDPEIRWQREPTRAARELLRRRYSRALLDRSLTRATVVVSTEATAEDLERNHRLAPGRASVVPLGVDLERFRPDDGGTSGTPYLFTLASSDDRDRTDLIIRAFAHYRHDLAGRCRLIVGGSLGERADGLGRLARQLGAADQISFTGRLSDDDLVTHNAHAVATVHASPDEGFGLQPLEAMACGSLLIATPAKAVEEVTVGAVVLWVDPSIDPMADAMRRAEQDPALVARAAIDNRRLAEGFSWDRTADTLHAMLVSMASS